MMHNALPAPRFPEPFALCSADDLCRAMRQVRGNGARVETAGLDRVLRLDARRALIEVQSATPWSALAARLGQAAPALETCLERGALAGTVGDAVASNAPGPDGRPLVELVEAITLVTPDATVRHASRLRDAELFALAVGGHGIFGPAYSVTLRVDALARAAARCRPAETLQRSDGGRRAARAITLLLPPERLHRFLGKARAHSEEWRVPIGRIDVVHTLPERDTVLRWAKQAYAAVTLWLELPAPLGGCVRGTQFCRTLIDCAIAANGSFPIASTPDASRTQLEACYPELEGVLAEKARRDPEARHGNAWYRHHRLMLDEARVAVRWDAAQAASA